MDKLLAYLNSLSPAAQRDYARRSGTTIGYLRKAISAGQRLGESLCINLDRESSGKVRCEDLAPYVDWAYVRNSAQSIADSTGPDVADRAQTSDDTQPPTGGSTNNGES
ncbi:Cro/Cl family transcriptional regulator [Paraburkholderia sp. JHI2823]|uniref:transcriptional regulator n=1 Tax=Paraburkholderia sp. JHI2823 TaxID=3112960 RepID=UPI00316CB354